MSTIQKTAPARQTAGRQFGQGIEEPARVDAIAWSSAICRLWDVATQEQKDMAVNLLNQDTLLGRMVVPIGPSIEELQGMLAAATPAPTADDEDKETAAMLVGLRAIANEADALPAADDAPGDSWDTWVDGDRWETTSLEPRFTFPEAIEHEAMIYRGRRTAVADFIGEELSRLAAAARFVGARNPAEFSNRRAALDA